MRDLILLAGEWPDTPDDTQALQTGADARVIHKDTAVPLADLPEGVEKSLCAGLASEWVARGVDIMALGKPGARLRANWDMRHENRLFAKAVRRIRALLGTQEYRVVGLLWVAAAGPEEAARFAELSAALRMAIGVPDLPVVAIPTNENTHLAEPPEDVTVLPAAPGITEMGASLGQALAYIAPPPRHIRWLWQGDMYQAWLVVPDGATLDHVVVSFPHMAGADFDGFTAPGFGQTAFEKRKTACVIIRSRQSNWFQDDEVLEMGRALKAALPARTHITTYGASMGGYGALLLSGLLDADRVVAIAPQFSITEQDVPWERRWRVHRERIGPFRHNLRAMMHPQARKHIFFDPQDADSRHVALMEPDQSFKLHQFPGAAHQVLRFLQETDTLRDFVAALCDPQGAFGPVNTAAHKARAQSPLYWLGIFRHFKSTNAERARAALDQCVALEGPRPKYLKRYAKL